MSKRVTRSSTVKEALALAKAERETAVQQSPVLSTPQEKLEEKLEESSILERIPKRGARGKPLVAKFVKKPVRKSAKKPVKKPAKKEDDPDELPHNLGKAFTYKDEDEDENDEKDEPMDELIDRPASKKRKKGKAAAKQKEHETVTDTIKDDATLEEKNILKPVNRYKLNTGVTPFPEWPHPTSEECQEVVDLLTTVHGAQVAPAAFPPPSLTISGCGEVPSVLDAVIRTVLSSATSKGNSAKALEGLVQTFGIMKTGIGKGSINWDSVRRAPRADVLQAIRSGGLAAIKSERIQRILDMVYEENKARRDALVESSRADPPSTTPLTQTQKTAEIALADANILSLNHIHTLSTHDAMLKLTSYPGIGLKTASCVCLFSLRRPSFAVDTHVFRLLKWLRWIPPQARNEVVAFKHIDAVTPDRFKYALHQLFIRHGQGCTRCKAATREGCEGWDVECVIEHLVIRVKGKRGGKGKVLAEGGDEGIAGEEDEQQQLAESEDEKVLESESGSEDDDEQPPNSNSPNTNTNHNANIIIVSNKTSPSSPSSPSSPLSPLSAPSSQSSSSLSSVS